MMVDMPFIKETSVVITHYNTCMSIIILSDASNSGIGSVYFIYFPDGSEKQ